MLKRTSARPVVRTSLWA